MEPAGERRERLNRSVPVVSRRVRIDDRSRLNRACFRNHGYLDARTDSRIKTDHALVARRGRKQQILQIGAEHRDSTPLSILTELLEDLGFKRRQAFDAPGPAADPGVPAARRCAGKPQTFMLRHHFNAGVRCLGFEFLGKRHFDGQHFVRAGPENGEHPM